MLEQSRQQGKMATSLYSLFFWNAIENKLTVTLTSTHPYTPPSKINIFNEGGRVSFTGSNSIILIGSTLNGKNLLPQQQILSVLSIKSRPRFGRVNVKTNSKSHKSFLFAKLVQTWRCSDIPLNVKNVTRNKLIYSSDENNVHVWTAKTAKLARSHRRKFFYISLRFWCRSRGIYS